MPLQLMVLKKKELMAWENIKFPNKSRCSSRFSPVDVAPRKQQPSKEWPKKKKKKKKKLMAWENIKFSNKSRCSSRFSPVDVAPRKQQPSKKWPKKKKKKKTYGLGNY